MSKPYPVSADFVAKSRVDKATCEKVYAESLRDPDETGVIPPV